MVRIKTVRPKYVIDQDDKVVIVEVDGAGSGGEPGPEGPEGPEGPAGPSTLTFGDLMHPALPSRMPAAKGQVAAGTALSWDGIGPHKNYNQVHEVIDFNGPVITSGFGAAVDPSGQNSSKVLDIDTVMVGTDAVLHYFNPFEDQTLMVWIDDEEVDVNPVEQGPAGSVYLTIQMNQYGTYRVRVAGGFFLYGTYSSNGTTLHKPTSPFTLGVVSDSYYESFPVFNVAESTAPQLRTATGFKILNMAQGGTGYINPGGGAGFSPYGSTARLDQLESLLPSINALLVNGSVNDRTYTAAALEAAMIAYFAAVADMAPDLPVVVCGLEPVSGLTFNGDHLQAQKNAVDASPNVVGYIDPLTEDWFTGTGNDVTLENDGNQDHLISGVDGVHTNRFGSKVYAVLTKIRMSVMKVSVDG